MITKTLDLNNIEQKIFWTLSSLLGIVLAFYLYSVLSLTVAVVDRNSMNTEVHQLADSASVLEAEYLSQTNSVTLAYAKSIGFLETRATFAKTSTASEAFAFAN